MPIKTDLWKVGESPLRLNESVLDSELQLEEMVVEDPRILSSEWLLIGRQVKTESGGFIDLLALAPDGSVVLIELKRDRTPREVVAQALDYASWVEGLSAENLVSIYARFAPDQELSDSFVEKFNQPLDEDQLNQSHQIIIVASALDASTERIVNYLNDRDIWINVLCFQVFSDGDSQYLSRTWLLDPVETQSTGLTPRKKKSEPWNGEFYCSYGDSLNRSWHEAVTYGFICGGGGAWFSRTLQLLSPGDRVWVNIPGTGYVGVGRVRDHAAAAQEFQITVDGKAVLAMDVLSEAAYHRDHIDDEEKCEYFVAIDWLDTKTLDDAVQEVGLFGNQNTVCKPTAPKWRTTVERLKVRFSGFDGWLGGAENIGQDTRNVAL